MEKYILRKAFDRPEDPYLPDEVLWRQKEQFSDGVGYGWVDGLKDYAERVVSVRGRSCSTIACLVPGLAIVCLCVAAAYLLALAAWRAQARKPLLPA